PRHAGRRWSTLPLACLGGSSPSASSCRQAETTPNSRRARRPACRHGRVRCHLCDIRYAALSWSAVYQTLVTITPLPDTPASHTQSSQSKRVRRAVGPVLLLVALVPVFTQPRRTEIPVGSDLA